LDFAEGYVGGTIPLTDKGLKILADLHLPKIDALELGHCNNGNRSQFFWD
jgi:hypothetical protein